MVSGRCLLMGTPSSNGPAPRATKPVHLSPPIHSDHLHLMAVVFLGNRVCFPLRGRRMTPKLPSRKHLPKGNRGGVQSASGTSGIIRVTTDLTLQLRSRANPLRLTTIASQVVMTSTATGIELEPGRASHLHAAHRAAVPADFDASSVDAVLEASRLADSTVPDGGYGWVVVAGSFVVSWWFVGTSYSWGVIQDALVADGVSSPAVLSFVGSLSAALISAFAIVNGRVVRALGARWAALLGVALLGLSELLSSFSVHNAAGLFFTSGVVLGLGMSLCFMVGFFPDGPVRPCCTQLRVTADRLGNDGAVLQPQAWPCQRHRVRGWWARWGRHQLRPGDASRPLRAGSNLPHLERHHSRYGPAGGLAGQGEEPNPDLVVCGMVGSSPRLSSQEQDP